MPSPAHASHFSKSILFFLVLMADKVLYANSVSTQPVLQSSAQLVTFSLLLISSGAVCRLFGLA